MSIFKKYLNLGVEGNDYISYEVLNIKDNSLCTNYKESNNESKLASYSYIQSKIRKLSGQILTIIDASIPEGKQNKCVKDLVRREILDMFGETAQDLLSAVSNTPPDDGIIETVSAEKIIGA